MSLPKETSAELQRPTSASLDALLKHSLYLYATSLHIEISTRYMIVSEPCLFQLTAASAYHIFTAFYQTDGRRFEEVGSYDNSTLRLIDDQDVFPNSQFGLNGRHMIVSTNYVRNCLSCSMYAYYVAQSSLNNNVVL